VLTKSGKTVGGGDITRKRKLLEKQKEGKKKMKTVANIELSGTSSVLFRPCAFSFTASDAPALDDVFLAVLRSDDQKK
jgi:hypothetical protein